jgi:hypothetical protein
MTAARAAAGLDARAGFGRLPHALVFGHRPTGVTDLPAG